MTQLSLILALIAGFTPIVCVRSTSDDDDSFNPKTVINKPFDAIKHVKAYAVNAKEVDVQDDELVIGIELDGHSRAYPVNMLNGPYREIINDTLGDIPIAATW